MQDEFGYKNGIKAWLMLAACTRELARRSGEDEEEITKIAKEAFDECMETVEGYTDDQLDIQINRAVILSDVMVTLVKEHTVEKVMAEMEESEDKCDGNYS